MITFKPIVISGNKRADGSYPVKIRVYFNAKVRRLPTTLVCYQKDLTRTLKIKNEDILNKAEDLIRRMRAVVADISSVELEHRDVDWVVNKIKVGIAGERFDLDFFEWADKFIQSKKPATRGAYIRALNAFERFLGTRQIDINDINKMLLLNFMEYIDEEPKMHYNAKTKMMEETEKKKVSKAAASLHLMKLQHIFNAAKDRYNDEDDDKLRIPRSPFDSIKKVFPSGGKGQEALDRKIIQRMIVAQVTDAQVRLAIDAFLVSFALMGANLADMFFAIPFKGNRWEYNRMKTGAETKVDIPPQILPHLKRLQENGDGEWWLPELHRIGAKKHTCNMKINEYLRRWQKSAKVQDFTFYAARHSWATITRSMGIDLAAVNDCLTHKDSLDMGRRYAPLSWEQMNDINRQVLESFVW